MDTPGTGNDVAGYAENVDACEAEEGADAGIEGDGGWLADQLRQDRDGIVRVIVVVDRIAREPHILGREMRTAQDRCQEPLVHKHFERLDVRIVAANPPQ